MRIWVRGVLTLLVCAFAMAPAWGQGTIPREYDKTIKSAEAVGALGNDLFGEETNLYTGSTSFTVTDVSLPGNNSLPVSIGRRFIVQSRDQFERGWLLTRDGTFGDWDVDIPHLHGVFAQGKGWQVDGWSEGGKNKRCSLSEANMAEPPVVQGSPHGFWAAAEYWNGNSLYIPGRGDQEMLVSTESAVPKPADGNTYTWITNSLWQFSCVPNTANGVLGEGFVALSPQGVRYRFDWIVKRNATFILKSSLGPVDYKADGSKKPSKDPINSIIQDPNASSLSREEVWILPTRIEDRSGNYVTYRYDSAHPWRLLSIEANDGRQLTLTYDTSGKVSTVSDGSRTWTYIYDNGLTNVVLPDQSRWTIDFNNLRAAYTQPNSNTGGRCEARTSSSVQNSFVGTITHPSGATGEFTFQSKMHGRSYVKKICVRLTTDPSELSEYAHFPYYFDVVGITRKKISGPGLPSAQWDFTFGPPNNSWEENCSNNSCASTKYTEVAGPEGTWNRYTFGNRYQESEGKLLKVESGSGPSNILRTETTAYVLNSSNQPYPELAGYSPFSRGDHSSEKFLPVQSRVTTQQGRIFTWQVASNCGSTGTTFCFDVFARPTKAIKSSAPAP